jgi:hypothetical protein
MADRLVRAFFEMVNPSWPVVEDSTFLARYRAFKSDRTFGEGGWETLLYVVMAVSARHLQLLQGLDNVDPAVFFSRSEYLRRNVRHDPAVATVKLQVLLLSSLYLALNNSLARFVSTRP